MAGRSADLQCRGDLFMWQLTWLVCSEPDALPGPEEVPKTCRTNGWTHNYKIHQCLHWKMCIFSTFDIDPFLFLCVCFFFLQEFVIIAPKIISWNSLRLCGLCPNWFAFDPGFAPGLWSLEHNLPLFKYHPSGTNLSVYLRPTLWMQPFHEIPPTLTCPSYPRGLEGGLVLVHPYLQGTTRRSPE